MRYVLLLSMFLYPLITKAQTVDYGGVVYDESLSNTNYFITLKNVEDSISYSEISENNNRFKFKNIPVGKYERCVRWLEKIQCDTLLIEKNISDDVIFITKEHILNEVVISATVQKPLIENKAGTLIVNVKDNPIMNSGNVFDAITKLPGISYNLSSNAFRLKGKAGILVQIDGESLLLSQNEVTEYLKTIPADDIENIEINSSPSSKYDASGVAGIINIVSKKNKREGYFANISLNATQGKYYKQNSNIKLHYNKKRSQYSFQYTNAFNTNFEKAISERQFSNVLSDQNTYTKIKGNTNTLNLNYLQEFNKSSLLLSAIGSFYSEAINQKTRLSFINNINSEMDSTIISQQNSDNKLKNLNLSLKYNVDLKNSKLTFRSHYLKYNIDNHSNLTSFSSPSNNSVDLDNTSPRTADLFVSQIDYSITIDSISSIEAGVKGIIQKLQNKNDFFDVGSGTAVYDVEKSNDFEYSESILSSYAEYKRNIKKFDFTVGSRMEYNPSKGYNSKNNYTLKRDELYFFPFLNIAYNHSENSNYNLSYSKRINRPSFSRLMPFDYYIDTYTILSGNPDLIPHFAHSIDLQYILKKKYVLGVNYTLNKNQIFQTPILNDSINTTVLKPLNIDNGKSVSFFNNSSFKLFKKLNVNTNIVFFYDKIKANQDNIEINSDNFSYQFTVNSSYKILKDYNFNLVFDYIAPFIQGPYKTDEIITLNASISKSFMENKLRISLIGNDILGTYKINNRLNSDIQNVYTKQTFDTRWIRLSLIYIFDKGLKKNSIETDKTVDDIKNRLQ
jgi:iron complex outermembrane recepter protein